MANERLQQALIDAGLTTGEVAEKLEVDDRTVERWLRGRIPYPRLRRLLAGLVGVTDGELWPQGPGTDEEGFAGDWWAAWQSSKGGKELVAVQPVHLDSIGGVIRWRASARGRPIAEGGFMWSGELRVWDNEIAMGHYVADDAAVRSKGSVFFRIHPQGRLLVGRWTGLSYDGWLFSGWGVLSRDEDECRATISDLIDEGQAQWLKMSYG